MLSVYNHLGVHSAEKWQSL